MFSEACEYLNYESQNTFENITLSTYGFHGPLKGAAAADLKPNSHILPLPNITWVLPITKLYL